MKLRNRHTRSGFEHLVVLAHNLLPWPIGRRLVRIVDFGDGTYTIGWRWSKHSWLVRDVRDARRRCDSYCAREIAHAGRERLPDRAGDTMSATRYDSGQRRQAKRSGREKGCWTYIPAEELARAGLDPGEPAPFYRVTGHRRSTNGHSAIVSLYREP